MPIKIFILLFSGAPLFANFENVRISNSPFYNGEPSIGANAGKVAVAYESYEFGNDEIMLTLSGDNGHTFGAPVRVTSTDSSSWRPKVWVNSGVDVVWEDKITGKREIFYRRLEGDVLGTQIKISGGGVYSAFPALTGRGRDLYIVWEDFRDGNDEIYFRKFEGGSWSAEKRLTTDDSTSWGADIAYDSITGALHVVFFDFRTGNDEVYYVFSADGGNSWTSPVNLSNDSRNSWEPRVAALNGRVTVTWYAWRTDLSAYEIFYTEKTGPGWQEPGIVSVLGADSKCPSITCSDSGVAIAWEDYGDWNDEIYAAFKAWNGPSWNISRITFESHDSFGADAIMVGNEVFLTWFDYRDGVDQIYFTRGLVEAISAEQSPARAGKWIQIFPNPVRNSAMALLGGAYTTPLTRLHVLDMSGRVVSTLVPWGKPGCYTWNPGGLSSGVYLLDARGKRGERMAERIILQR